MIGEGRIESHWDEPTVRHVAAWAKADEQKRGSAEALQAVLDSISAISPFRALSLRMLIRRAYNNARHERPETLLERMRNNLSKNVTAAGPLANWIRIFHANGFVREGALKGITTPPPSAALLGELLARLNDNVPQVRTAAADCVRQLTPTLDATQVMEVLQYCFRDFSFWERLEHHDVISAVIARPDISAMLQALLAQGTQSWLPCFFRNLLATDAADAWLADLALGASHIAIRTRALTVLMDGSVRRLPGYREVVISEKLGKMGRVFSRGNQRQIDIVFDIVAIIAATARHKSIKVRKASAQGLVIHYRTIDNPDAVLADFDSEKNTAVLERVTYVRRKLAESA